MNDLDTLARRHADIVNRVFADAEPPPVAALGRGSADRTASTWHRGLAAAVAAAALVLAVVVPMALLSDGGGGPGAGPGASTSVATGSACRLPSEDERAAPPAPFTLSISPSAVEAGDIVGLSMDFEEAPPGDAVTGAGAAWQCWNGSEWVDTHQLVKDEFGPGGRPVAIVVEPGATTTIPSVGLSVAQPHRIVIPGVEPGIYRIRDEAFYGGESYDGYVMVLVAATTFLGEADTLEGVPEWCPVTVPGYDAFTPFAEMPEGPPPVYDEVWYGSPQLWTKLASQGEKWSGSNRTFWWSDAYSPQDPGRITVTARQLGEAAPIVEASEVAGTGFSPFMLMPTHESVTLLSIEIPEPGCWEVTGEYEGTTLSYVIWFGSTP